MWHEKYIRFEAAIRKNNFFFGGKIFSSFITITYILLMEYFRFCPVYRGYFQHWIDPPAQPRWAATCPSSSTACVNWSSASTPTGSRSSLAWACTARRTSTWTLTGNVTSRGRCVRVRSDAPPNPGRQCSVYRATRPQTGCHPQPGTTPLSFPLPVRTNA